MQLSTFPRPTSTLLFQVVHCHSSQHSLLPRTLGCHCFVHLFNVGAMFSWSVCAITTLSCRITGSATSIVHICVFSLHTPPLQDLDVFVHAHLFGVQDPMGPVVSSLKHTTHSEGTWRCLFIMPSALITTPALPVASSNTAVTAMNRCTIVEYCTRVCYRSASVQKIEIVN